MSRKKDGNTIEDMTHLLLSKADTYLDYVNTLIKNNKNLTKFQRELLVRHLASIAHYQNQIRIELQREVKEVTK